MSSIEARQVESTTSWVRPARAPLGDSWSESAKGDKPMKLVGALTESAPLSDLAPNRGPAIERAAIDDAAPDAPVPWLLALIPVGSLVMAGLLVLLLARFVAMPVIPPSIESSLDDALDLGMPTADEVEGDAWVRRVGLEFTR
jgi:hypothetical protein